MVLSGAALNGLRQGGRLIAAVIGGGFLLISVGIAWGIAA